MSTVLPSTPLYSSLPYNIQYHTRVTPVAKSKSKKPTFSPNNPQIIALFDGSFHGNQSFSPCAFLSLLPHLFLLFLLYSLYTPETTPTWFSNINRASYISDTFLPPPPDLAKTTPPTCCLYTTLRSAHRHLHMDCRLFPSTKNHLLLGQNLHTLPLQNCPTSLTKLTYESTNLSICHLERHLTICRL